MVDYTKFEKIILSDASDEEIHPNIDARSFRKFKREQRERIKQEKEEKLLKLKEEYKKTNSNKILDEIKKLETELKPQFKEKYNSTKTYTDNKNKDEYDYTNDLVYLIENNKLNDFINYKDNIKDLNEFENFVLHNLAVNIKEKNDEAGLRICNVSLYVKYLKEHGIEFLEKLAYKLSNSEFLNVFSDDCKSHYESSKSAILGLYK